MRIYNTVLLIVIFTLLFIGCGGGGGESTPNSQITPQNNKVFNFSEIKAFTAYTTLVEEDFAEAKRIGINCFRIMLMDGDLMIPNLFFDPTADKLIIPSKLLKLQQLTHMGMKYGIKIIFDLHEQPGYVRFDSTQPNNLSIWEQNDIGIFYRKLTISIWRQIAEVFAETKIDDNGNIVKVFPDDWVAFEVMNEPEPKSPSNMHENRGYLSDALMVDCYLAIREIDPTRFIIVSPPYSWRASSMIGWDLPIEMHGDHRLGVSFHFYHPHTYTMQWNAWPSENPDDYASYPGKFGYTSYDNKLEEWNYSRMIEELIPAVNFQAKYPYVQIVITEFSVMRTVANATKWLEDAISAFEFMGFGWCYHVFKEEEYFRAKGREFTNSLWELDRAPYDRIEVIRRHL